MDCLRSDSSAFFTSSVCLLHIHLCCFLILVRELECVNSDIYFVRILLKSSEDISFTKELFLIVLEQIYYFLQYHIVFPSFLL